MKKITGITLSLLLLSGCNLTTSTIGVGRITSDDSNIDCGWYASSCNHNYGNNESTSLTAVAAPYYNFIGWEGDCSGTEECTLSLAQSKSVTAVFEPQLDLPIAIDEVEFNSTALKECLTIATAREGWVYNTDVTELECRGEDSIFAGSQGININDLEGMQVFSNLMTLTLNQKCYLTGPLISAYYCDGPMPTKFTALSNLPIETLTIDGGWIESNSILTRTAPYRVTNFPEIPSLIALDISGLVNSNVPDITNLPNLASYRVSGVGSGFKSLGSLAEGAADNLLELTLLTDTIPCAEIEQTFTTHDNLAINGETQVAALSCVD